MTVIVGLLVISVLNPLFNVVTMVHVKMVAGVWKAVTLALMTVSHTASVHRAGLELTALIVSLTFSLLDSMLHVTISFPPIILVYHSSYFLNMSFLLLKN